MSDPGHITDMATGDSEAKEYFVLTLFIAGASSNSLRAVASIRQICDDHLQGNYSLEIIDVHQDRVLAEEQQLIALPMLLKKAPLPERRLIGDMSDTNKVLKGLGIIH